MLAKVIMTCGRICSGKSTYAQKLTNQHKAVVLSVVYSLVAMRRVEHGISHTQSRRGCRLRLCSVVLLRRVSLLLLFMAARISLHTGQYFVCFYLQ